MLTSNAARHRPDRHQDADNRKQTCHFPNAAIADRRQRNGHNFRDRMKLVLIAPFTRCSSTGAALKVVICYRPFS